jgi:hypothetical protein
MFEISEDARAEMQKVARKSAADGGKAIRVYLAGYG